MEKLKSHLKLRGSYFRTKESFYDFVQYMCSQN